jgi:glycosyltransferase involved in cell wall biosynthesis
MPNPFTGPGPHLVFTGTMDYRPNIDAAVWFTHDILPRVRVRMPNATFAVVGAKPSREVQALAATPGVIVTGKVPDVRPYLRHADVVVAPLRLARGIQNKVLEGMAMGRPVVTSPQGLEGIEAKPGHDLLVAATPDAFADAIMAAHTPSGSRLGEAARALMVASYAWPSRLSVLDRLMA